MKTYKKINTQRIVLDKVTCDRCKNDCTNTHMDIKIQYTFSDTAGLFETICWKCYEEHYHKRVMELRDKEFNDKFVFDKEVAQK